MMIRNSIAALFAAAPLLLVQQSANALSPSCSTTYEGNIPPFDQTCQNSCSTGANAGELVGPGVLTSGEARQYDVAGLYFGHQN